MKESKWLFPIFIIALFCAILFMRNGFVVKQLQEAKERKIEEEKKLAYAMEEKFENNTSAIKDIQTGNSYTAILKEDGTVWVTGINCAYTSDYTYEGIQNNQFTKVRIENVKQIGVGNEFVIALKEDGEVYSWGGNAYSTLGIQDATIKPYQVPRKVPIEDIETIYVFGNQVAALSKDQTAYYWGYAIDDYDTKIPQKLKEKVKEIYLIQHQYYFKTVNDEIYGVGYDFDGITDQINGWAREPIKLDLQNVKKIVSYQGYENSGKQNNKYIIKNDGSVWKLDTLGAVLETKIEGLQNIENIYPYQAKDKAQEEPAFLAIDKNGNVYQNSTTGKIEKLNMQGVNDIVIQEGMAILVKEDGTIWNLGESIEDFKQREGGYSPSYCYEPEQIDVKNSKLVTIGSGFMLVVDRNNNIYRHGSNQKGQLGAGENKECQDLELIYTSNMNYHYDKIQETLNPKNTNNIEEVFIDPSMGTMAD